MTLRAVLREAASIALRFSGVPRLIRMTAARKGVTIIVYHDPRPEVVERHLAYIKQRYHVITLDRLGDALHSGNWVGIPRHALVVTIDDGHIGNRDLAPVFSRHDVVPTIFLCSQIVGTNRAFWFQLNDTDASALKRIPNQERLATLKRLKGYECATEYAEPTALSSSDLQEMRGVVDFGAHTRFHPILPMCDDDECSAEIGGSRADLEDRFNAPCKHFAYPNGDFGERELKVVRGAGFQTARTTAIGRNHRGADPYSLRVTGVTDNASVNMLAVQLSGISGWIRSVLCAE